MDSLENIYNNECVVVQTAATTGCGATEQSDAAAAAFKPSLGDSTRARRRAHTLAQSRSANIPCTYPPHVHTQTSERPHLGDQSSADNVLKRMSLDFGK